MKKIILFIILAYHYVPLIINFFVRIFVGGTDFAFSYYKNDSKIKPFYFIHIPKNMGTLVHYHLSKSYNDKYYMYGYLNSLIPTVRDHVLIDDLIKYDPTLKNLPMIAIIRDPIPRFISVCNFLGLSPKYFISLIKKFGHLRYPSIYNLYNIITPQVEFITSKHNLNIHVFKMEDKTNIKNAFLKYDLDIDFNKKINDSKKKYSINDLDNNDLDFLHKHYKKDTEFYSKIPIGGLKLFKD